MLRKLIKSTKIRLNKLGNKKKCYVCHETFYRFSKFRGGSKNRPEFMKKLDMVGSDPDNFFCYYCWTHDRERHLFMFFDKLNLWDQFKAGSVMHFAPEKNLSARIISLKPALYVKGDLYPKDASINKIDATAIPSADNTFDVLICNHVIEHIPSYLIAMKEIYRVLKPGGMAILQTPYSKLLKHNFEDENITTKEQRNYFYGQQDHARVVSEEQFFHDLEKTGFKLAIARNNDFFTHEECAYYGVNSKEDLVRVYKQTPLPQQP
jgi:SAM-dependent methyltransferase